MFTRRTGIIAAIATAAASLVGACMPSPARGDRLLIDDPRWPEGDAMILDRCGADGAKWAAEFCRIARAKGLELDEGWMIGWFANAIETGHAVKLQTLERKLGDCMAIASCPLNWRASDYAHGYANGIILGYAVLTGREPEFHRRLRYDKASRSLVSVPPASSSV